MFAVGAAPLEGLNGITAGAVPAVAPKGRTAGAVLNGVTAGPAEAGAVDVTAGAVPAGAPKGRTAGAELSGVTEGDAEAGAAECGAGDVTTGVTLAGALEGRAAAVGAVETGAVKDLAAGAGEAGGIAGLATGGADIGPELIGVDIVAEGAAAEAGRTVLDTAGGIAAPVTVVLTTGVAAHCGLIFWAGKDGREPPPLMPRVTATAATAATVAAMAIGTGDRFILGAMGGARIGM